MRWPFGKKDNQALDLVPMERAEPVVATAAELVPEPVTNSAPSVAPGAGMGGVDVFTFMTGGLARTGMPVNEQTAMSLATVYACVGLIGSALAAMPLHTYKRTALSQERADHELWDLFNVEPWPSYTAAVFWEYCAWSILLHGDFFGKIHRVSPYSPQIAGIEPIHPMMVTVQSNEDRLVYVIQRGMGKAEALDQDDVLHVPGKGFNGLRGMSTLRYALKGPAGVALAADEFAGAYFRNGGKTDVALVAPGRLDPEQVTQMRENWRQNQGALGEAWLPHILSGGVKIEQLKISAQDAQLLETRKLTDEQICRIFLVPPHMVGITEKASSFGTGIEQLGMGFVRYTMSGIYTKIEQEINRKCLRRKRYFVAFDPSGLLRGDMKARFDAYRVGLGRAGEQPFMTVDEVRANENLPPMKLDKNPAPGAGNEPQPVEPPDQE